MRKIILSAVLAAGIAVPAMAALKLQWYVPCLLKGSTCSIPNVTQGPIIDNGAYPFFYAQSGYSMGDVAVGASKTLSFVISNIGTGDLTVYGFQLNNDSGAFKIVKNDCPVDQPFKLRPNGACSVNVMYSPSEIGPATTNIVIKHSSAAVQEISKQITGNGTSTQNGDGTGTVYVPPGQYPSLPKPPVGATDNGGTGYPTAFSITPTAYTFPDTNVGATMPTKSFTLTNISDYDRAITKLDAPEFVVSQNCYPILAKNSSCTITVGMPTTTPMSFSSLLTIRNDLSQSVQVPLSGKVLGSNLNVNPGSVDLVSAIGNTTTQTLVITNTGNVAADLSEISYIDSQGTSSNVIMNGINTGSGGAGSNTVQMTTTTCTTTLAPGATCTVPLSYAPANGTAVNGTVTVKSGSKTFTVPVYAKGVIQSLQLTVSPSTFPKTDVGTNVVGTLAIKNVDAAAVAISGITSTSASFSTTHTCTSIAAGATCNESITFAPKSTQLGTIASTLTVAHSGEAKSASAYVTGSASSKSILITGNLNFGSMNLDGLVGERSVSIQNNGSDPLTISSATIGSPFAITNNNCGTLTPSQICQISVKVNTAELSPQIYSGELTITGTFTQGTTNAPATISVVADQPVSNTSILSFGQVPVGTTATQQWSITNKGSTAFTVDTVELPSVNYGYTHDCTNIAKGGSCVITVSYTGTSAHLFTVDNGYAKLASTTGQVLQIAANAAAKGAVLRNAYTLPDVNYGDVKVNTNVVRNITLINDGNIDLTIKNVHTDSPFLILSHNCGTIPSKQSCTIPVQVNTSVLGMQYGRVTFDSNHNNQNSSHQVNLQANAYNGLPALIVDGSRTTGYDFGEVWVGNQMTKTMTIVNQGDTTATLALNYNPNYSTTNTLYYDAAKSTCQSVSSLGAGESCTLTMSLKSDTTNNANSAKVSAVVGMTANGTSSNLTFNYQPVQSFKSISPTSLTMGDTAIVGSQTKTITISSDTRDNKSMDFTGAWVVNGDVDNEITVADNCGSYIAIKGTCTVSVTYTPKVAKDITTINISRATSTNVTASGSAVSMAATITLQAGPWIATAPSATNFGTISQGSYKDVSFTLQNLLNYPLNVTSSLTNTGSNAFSIISNNCTSVGKTTCNIVVRFTPNAVGAVYGMLHLDTNDTRNASIDVSLTGDATNGGPTFTVDGRVQNTFDFGTLGFYENQVKTVTLTNYGTQAISITDASKITYVNSGTTSASVVDINNCLIGKSIAAGASCVFQMKMTTGYSSSATTQYSPKATFAFDTAPSQSFTVSAYVKDSYITNPGTITFGGIPYGTTKTMSGIISNASGTDTMNLLGNWTIASVSAPEGASEILDVTDNCTNVPAGGSCTVSITVTSNASASTTRTASLQKNSDGYPGLANVNISWTANSGNLSASVQNTVAANGRQYAKLSLTNSGSNGVGIVSFTSTNDLRLEETGVCESVAAGFTCLVSVSYIDSGAASMNINFTLTGQASKTINAVITTSNAAFKGLTWNGLATTVPIQPLMAVEVASSQQIALSFTMNSGTYDPISFRMKKGDQGVSVANVSCPTGTWTTTGTLSCNIKIDRAVQVGAGDDTLQVMWNNVPVYEIPVQWEFRAVDATVGGTQVARFSNNTSGNVYDVQPSNYGYMMYGIDPSYSSSVFVLRIQNGLTQPTNFAAGVNDIGPNGIFTIKQGGTTWGLNMYQMTSATTNQVVKSFSTYNSYNNSTIYTEHNRPSMLGNTVNSGGSYIIDTYDITTGTLTNTGALPRLGGAQMLKGNLWGVATLDAAAVNLSFKVYNTTTKSYLIDTSIPINLNGKTSGAGYVTTATILNGTMLVEVHNTGLPANTQYFIYNETLNRIEQLPIAKNVRGTLTDRYDGYQVYAISGSYYRIVNFNGYDKIIKIPLYKLNNIINGKLVMSYQGYIYEAPLP